jgi:hypothetical protein
VSGAGAARAFNAAAATKTKANESMRMVELMTGA